MSIGFLKNRRQARAITRAGYQGPFGSWAEAVACATGYDAGVILERQRAAATQVRAGQAVYERDSVLFDHVEYSWPLVAALLRTAALESRLSVLDFGGALGSSYYQNRGWLKPLSSWEWSVVEQPHFVECGRREFSDDRLQFYASVAEVLAVRRPNLILLSSVLQYLEDPQPVMRELANAGAGTVLIDRAPVDVNGPSRIYVQQVPPEIYPASYPLRVMNQAELLGGFPGYQLAAQFRSYCDAQKPFAHLGYLLTREVQQ